MIEALNNKGYNAFSISVPSPEEFLAIVGLAAPVFVTMMAKVTYRLVISAYNLSPSLSFIFIL